MQDSDLPIKFSIPWGFAAGGALIRPIPTASQIGITPGAASLTDGFPPLNALIIAAGGIPPNIADHNGILSQITLWLRWAQAGGPMVYDATFQAAIGGYPAGAKIGSATTVGRTWLSTVDNNVTNPDASGAGWVAFPVRGRSDFNGSTAWTVPVGTNFAAFEVWGSSSGSGGSASATAAGGAGGAGYSTKAISVKAGDVYTFASGAAGTAGTTGANGGSGGVTTLTGTGVSISIATSGFGGGSSGGGGGGPGALAGTGGDINLPGGNGGNGVINGTLYLGGPGGTSPFGGSVTGNTVGTAWSGNTPGGGGSGGANAQPGVVGTPGYLRINFG